jgi:hypothetical protein
MSKIVDTFARSNIELEYQLKHESSERLKNEYNRLLVEQREIELKKVENTKDETKLRGLEEILREAEADISKVQESSQPNGLIPSEDGMVNQLLNKNPFEK